HQYARYVKKLFLLDGMALIYRAYFALSKSPRITSTGFNTSAIFGFANTLLEVLRTQQPTHIAVVLDTMAPTNRHVEFESYKANRQAIPEDLAAAIPYVYKLVEGFNIPLITLDGYEADDIIGTLAKQAEAKGYTVFCMTPDKDFGQLVTENIFIYKPARLGNGAETLGVAEILEKWEVSDVKQVIDILGLWGDSVDNIPGIPGIGEKTAKSLIKQFGSMEGVLANTDQLKGKQRENLETFAEQGLISKKLATIQLDVPVELDEERLLLGQPNREVLEPLFAELEFRTLGRRVFGEEFNTSAQAVSGTQMDLFGNAAGAATDVLSPGPEYVPPTAGKNVHNTPHNYVLADSPELQQELAALLAKQRSFCFDTETTGTDANTADLVGLSFAIEPGKAWYVPTPCEKEGCLDVLAHFKPI